MSFFARRKGAVVIQTAYMGDVILTTPLLGTLAGEYGPVDVVTTPQSAPLLEAHPAVRNVIRYDKRGDDKGWPGLRRVAAAIRKHRYEAAYLPHRSWRSATLVLLARVPVRIGFEDSAAAPLYTRRLPRPVHAHETQRLWSLAEAEPGTPMPPVSLGLGEADHAAADHWLRSQGVSEPFIALGPGSPWGAKRWAGFAGLAAALDVAVVAIGGPTDHHLGEQIAAAAPGRAFNACGQVGPRVSAALIARAEALVTNDSSPLHLGLAVGTRMVALFGPTVPSFGFGPTDSRDISLGLDDLLCRPCATFGPAVCPLDHHRCLRDLTLDHVLAAVAELRRRRTGSGGAPD